MAATLLNNGPTYWDGRRSDDGHRDYVVRFKVGALTTDGPQTVTFAPGLPSIGSPWIYGNDFDPWAFCTPYLKATPLLSDEPNQVWTLEYKFTTRPMTRCNTTTIENPLAEPDTIGGSFINGKREATQDKDGNLIQTSSFETVEAEFDENFPTVTIGQNVLDLDLSEFAGMVNKVNDATLWGMGTRQIKLSSARWERKLYGICTFYYTRVFTFEVNPDTFDRDDIPDKGRKLIAGAWKNLGTEESPNWDWIPEPGVSDTEPSDYIIANDRHGNPTEHFLAAGGLPSTTPTYIPTVQYYKEADFLTLGIPSSLT